MKACTIMGAWQAPHEGIEKPTPTKNETKNETKNPKSLRYLHCTKLSLGSQHGSAVLNGNVHTWGKTQSGRLGHGDIVEEQQWARHLSTP